ncbi:MAG TPA: enoyl-CoA hydratase/isomerase family protein [Acidimicrobiia bacterium]|nr:enoyl-CoA hydratase/isomerase family protein [Acidimicrobiia bacterium]
MASDNLVIERDGAVQWIRLNRPQVRNMIDLDTRAGLVDAFVAADDDATVRAIVVTGSGRDFCTGGDVGRPAGGDHEPPPPRPVDYRRLLRPFQDLFRTYWELDTPVVSAVNGTTAGVGWMLALLADLVVAAEGARWTHAFLRRGMIPHAGDPFFLPRVLPLHRLTEVAMLSDTLTSETLADWGVVNRLVPPEEVEATASELAQRLASGPTRSLALAKRLYRRSLTSDMATMFGEEADASALLTTTDDRQEGVRAFLEGRAPEFTGN